MIKETLENGLKYGDTQGIYHSFLRQVSKNFESELC